MLKEYDDLVVLLQENEIQENKDQDKANALVTGTRKGVQENEIQENKDQDPDNFCPLLRPQTFRSRKMKSKKIRIRTGLHVDVWNTVQQCRKMKSKKIRIRTHPLHQYHANILQLLQENEIQENKDQDVGAPDRVRVTL